MMESSQFTNQQPSFETMELIASPGATCDTFFVKLYGKLHFLKRLKPQYTNDIRYQEAFRKEFETGYRLEHPHLVRYISLSDDGILMEYIDGETLSQRLSRDPDYFRSRSNSDRFVRQLLDAVGYLHSHQILHLDLKPDNILLTRINDDVKLIDLGCCRTDTFVDTPGYTNRYAAPEQLSGGEVDARTDIYAIGKIIEQLPCHSRYNKVTARCTAENPDDRYQSVADLSASLRPSRWKYLSWMIPVSILFLALLWMFLPEPPKRSSEPPSSAEKAVPSAPRQYPVQSQKSETTHDPSSPSVMTNKPTNAKPASSQEPETATSLTEKQQRAIYAHTLSLIRPVYQRMIAPVVEKVCRGECDDRLSEVRDSLARVYVNANEEVFAAMRRNPLESRYPSVPAKEIYTEVNNAIGDAMHYYSSFIEHYQYPQIKIPPSPF